MIRAQDPLEALRRFFVGGAFPVFVLCLLALYELLLVGLLLVPPGGEGLGAFAEEFRVWCLGYDPATGLTDWSYALAMIAPQLLVAATVVLFWWGPLREALARPRRLLLPAGAAALLVGGAAAGLALSGTEAPSGELPFPAEALRVSLRAPRLELTNQAGEPVALPALRGKVVVLTAVYATCGHTCPRLLTESKQAVAQLAPEQREDLRVVAVTLDPAQDSQEVLAGLSRMQEMPAPLYNLVTGDPVEVERVLDEMGVRRQRDPETGVIDHASLFLLLDRQGRVAYRLGLGKRQRSWLGSALKVLLDEQPEAG